MCGTLRHHMVAEPNRTVCLNEHNGAVRGSELCRVQFKYRHDKDGRDCVLLSGSLPEFQ
jgi:hypothetical protein